MKLLHVVNSNYNQQRQQLTRVNAKHKHENTTHVVNNSHKIRVNIHVIH